MKEGTKNLQGFWRFQKMAKNADIHANLEDSRGNRLLPSTLLTLTEFTKLFHILSVMQITQYQIAILQQLYWSIGLVGCPLFCV